MNLPKEHRKEENAVVTIRSIQRTDDDTDASELNTTARYLYRNGKAKIVANFDVESFTICFLLAIKQLDT